MSPTKDDLQSRVVKRDEMLNACRAERTALALRVTELEAKLAECEGSVPDPEPPPDPPPPPPPTGRAEWKPTDATKAPAKGDFPSLAAKNVGLLDPAILTTKTGFTPAAGATYENLDIKNSFRPATGNTFRNCRVTADGYWAVIGAGTFFDCELIGRSDGDAAVNIQGGSYDRCYLHGAEDGAKIDAGTLRDCLVIDNKGGSAAHFDGLQTMGGRNMLVRHCHIEIPAVSGGTAAFIVSTDFGAIDNVRIEYNYLNGHSWTVYSIDNGHGIPTNVRMNYNRFGPAVYGAWTGTFAEKTGNVWDDDGSSLTTGNNR